MRSATRVMLLCPDAAPPGPILRMFDTATFAPVGSLLTPQLLSGTLWADFAYLGGDAVALLAPDLPLQILHAPLISNPP